MDCVGLLLDRKHIEQILWRSWSHKKSYVLHFNRVIGSVAVRAIGVDIASRSRRRTHL